MKRIIVRLEGNNIFEEKNNKRNYFFTEAFNIINEIELNQSDKIMVYITIVTKEIYKKEFIYNLGDNSFEENFFKALSEIKEINIEQIKEIINKENQLLKDDKFQMFVARFDSKFGDLSNEPFPLYLNIDPLYDFYKSVESITGHLFYAKLPNAIERIKNLFEVVFKIINLTEGSEEQKESFYLFLENEVNLKKMCNYISARLVSLSPERINALYPNNRMFHDIQMLIFTDLAFFMSFNEIYKIHKDMIQDFQLTFNLELFKGTKFEKDNDFDKLVIENVVLRYKDKLNKLKGEFVKES